MMYLWMYRCEYCTYNIFIRNSIAEWNSIIFRKWNLFCPFGHCIPVRIIIPKWNGSHTASEWELYMTHFFFLLSFRYCCIVWFVVWLKMKSVYLRFFWEFIVFTWFQLIRGEILSFFVYVTDIITNWWWSVNCVVDCWLCIYVCVLIKQYRDVCIFRSFVDFKTIFQQIAIAINLPF